VGCRPFFGERIHFQPMRKKKLGIRAHLCTLGVQKAQKITQTSVLGTCGAFLSRFNLSERFSAIFT
jgi:hypothetical protein